IFQGLRTGEPPQLCRSLLLDAEERLRTLRLGEAIIALGTACEVASDDYLQRLGKAQDPQAKRIGRLSVSFAEKRFNLLPTQFSGRSLKIDEPGIFGLVERMYRTRN